MDSLSVDDNSMKYAFGEFNEITLESYEFVNELDINSLNTHISECF